MKYLFLVALSIVGGVLGAYFLVHSDILLGATVARTTITNPYQFNQIVSASSTVIANRFIQGSCTSTTTPASAVLSANDFDAESCLTTTMAGSPSVTLTLPPASNSAVWAAWGLATSGLCRDLIFENASTTPNTRVTLASGANVQLFNASSSLIIPPSVGGATTTAVLRLCRAGTTVNPSFVGYLFNGSR